MQVGVVGLGSRQNDVEEGGNNCNNGSNGNNNNDNDNAYVEKALAEIWSSDIFTAISGEKEVDSR